ncbi:complement resistance protein TraT [Escherichia coli]|nr:complement resistance protein TraT [Escherichia coli]
MKMKKLMMVALVSSTLALSGCGAMSTAIKKRNLEVKTQMSETIWLEPASERTVFLQIKNTSDKDMSGLQGKIADAVKAKGYQVVTSPDKAYYWIQANVLKADKMDLRESQGWLNRGYEGAAVGAALGLRDHWLAQEMITPAVTPVGLLAGLDGYDLINKTSRVSPDSGRFYEPDTVLDHRERVRLFIQIQFPHGSDWSEVLRLTDIVTEKVSSGRAAGGYHHRHTGYTWSVSVN